MNKNTGDVLSSVFEIEQILQCIQEEDENIEYLQNLKRHRDRLMSEQIAAIREKVETYRQVILNTMHEHEPSKKTLPFPGVGKVTRRKSADNWSIDNEVAMLDHLKRVGVKDDVVEIKEVINRRKLKSTLDILDQQGDAVAGVSKQIGKEGLSISFEDEDKPKPKKAGPKAQPSPDIGSLTV